ncbi:MAG: ABC transporter substrate-binding protein [Endomicrobiales bacterium]
MVFGGVTYPVEGGLIQAFSKPTGANISGVSYGVPPTLRLSLIRKIFPDRAKFKRMAFVFSSSVPQEVIYSDALKELQDTSGWKLEFVDITDEETKKPDFESLVRQLGQLKPDVIMGWFTLDEMITDPARFARLQVSCNKPLLGLTSKSTDDGALGGVLTDHLALGAQQAVMAARVLKGEDPAAILPEQPKKYLIELNLKKAKELGIELPATIIAGASRIIK